MIEEIKKVLLQIINLRDTTDIKGTIDSVRNGIQIRGYNVWILACGAMLASIGLDQNSGAVIIGAMLISPLMSPILGIGLSMGINDRKNLYLALENFFIAVASVLIVSTLYFLVTPLGTLTAEIKARTYPTILDVLVAIFGGIAGIVASSRKDKTNAIPGVAIATALMPPLCVGGYGLAKGDLSTFGGAMYLFFINSVFIALSTYLIVRFLRFPFIGFVDEASRKKMARWMTIFVILMVLPSAYFMYNVWQGNTISGRVERFIAEQVDNDTHEVLKYEFATADSIDVLTIAIAGPAFEEDTLVAWKGRMGDYGLAQCDLHVIQSPKELKADEVISQASLESMRILQPQIARLQKTQDSLMSVQKTMVADSLPLRQLYQEVPILFKDLQDLSIGESIQTDLKGMQDTILTIISSWNPRLSRRSRNAESKKLGEWIQVKMQVDTVRMVAL
ncbi:MAG: DUF389 domain-containing protein [Bacteroidota bacterium]